MEQNTLEEKLKMENEIAVLRRELKNVLAQTTGAKSEYNAIVGLIASNKKLLDEQKEYLKQVQNDISQTKLDWLKEKNADLQELELKNAQVDEIIKRKNELDIQEIEIRKVEQNDIAVRNETRRLEFKLEQDKTAHQVKINELAEEKKKHEADKLKLQNDKKAFKNKVLLTLKEIELWKTL